MLKYRLDNLLTELGFFESREKARTAIMSNYIKLGGKLLNKAGDQINLGKYSKEFLKEQNLEINLEENDLKELPIEFIEFLKSKFQVDDKSCPYVSRGAYKLKAAAENFNLDFNGKIILDIGASTGGFSDFALQSGAKKVIAVDVGKGQLDYKLRDNPQILNIEGQNFRHIEFEQLKLGTDEQIDIVVSDLSFISIVKVLDKLKELISKSQGSKPEIGTQFIFLIKPQFEAGKEIIDKCKGVIKDEKIRNEVKDQTIEQIEAKGFKLQELTESPITGAKGNIEFLAYFLLCKLSK